MHVSVDLQLIVDLPAMQQTPVDKNDVHAVQYSTWQYTTNSSPPSSMHLACCTTTEWLTSLLLRTTSTLLKCRNKSSCVLKTSGYCSPHAPRHPSFTSLSLPTTGIQPLPSYALDRGSGQSRTVPGPCQASKETTLKHTAVHRSHVHDNSPHVPLHSHAG
jgi:hypothetical protein